MNKRIYMASPTMHGDELKYIQEAFDTNWIAPLGPNVNHFEEELAAYLQEDMYCAALSSGTAALHLAVKLLNIKEQDTVLCSSFTFSASANPAAYERANLVFIDSEPDTWNMSPQALRKALIKYPDAKAVILVHLYGTPAKLDEIMEICREYNVPLIEDAAESLGATYKGRHTGCFGKYSALSFNGNKIITTSGGGMFLAHEKEEADKARYLATQAREPARHYEHVVLGYNYRMSNITAGIGRGQLHYIEEHIERKKAIYETYQKAFADLPVKMNPYDKDNSVPNFWLSCITINPESDVTPDQVMNALEAENIECRPLWKPMHLQPVFAECGFVTQLEADPKTEETGSVCEDLFRRGVTLPTDIKNTEEDMEKIIGIIRGLF
ncbi:MAG: DegT/DnrJ/EryC1/StrS family aminotransferase [Lachnospiraceae bacterium]|nr:DegT/DnrJ/EryC1/StrS family aminotransferase [Lachnospiraceae bacterium]